MLFPRLVSRGHLAGEGGAVAASGKNVRGEESSPNPILRLKVWGLQETAVMRRREGRRVAGAAITGRGTRSH